MDAFASLALSVPSSIILPESRTHVRPHYRCPRNHKADLVPIRNAYIDFTKMTTSLVAVVTISCAMANVVVARFQFERPLRPGRIDPRALCATLMEATRTAADDAGDNLIRTGSGRADVERKPGGHGERSVAVALSTWRCGTGGQIAGKPRSGCSPNATNARRTRASSSMAGGYYYPGKDLSRCAARMPAIRSGYNVVR